MKLDEDRMYKEIDDSRELPEREEFPTTFSLVSLLSQYNATIAERGDEDVAHVSDLYGCDRATWIRRSGGTMIGFNDDTRMKFALGNAVENIVAKALESTLDDAWTLRRDVQVALYADGTGHEITIASPFALDAEHLVGHIDYLLERGSERVVVEVKSTTFFPRKINGKSVRLPPDEAQYHYRLQAAAYAMAVGAPRFCILVVCRDSGMVAEFWYNTEAMVDVVRDRIGAVIALTDPRASQPPAEPPSYADGPRGNWLCRYCKAISCPKNENADALVIPA